MIRINLVADGERDAATVPHLIETILGAPVLAEPHHWARLNVRGSGYPKKLLFAIRQAKDAGADGLVAVVDRDKAPQKDRLRGLREAREGERAKHPPYPTALGEADPHGEAWLLDDSVAVRRALALDVEVEILTVRRAKSPKETLNALIGGSSRAGDDLMVVLSDIARAVEPMQSRCMHAKETGFQDFVDEVRSELGPVTKP